MNRFTLLAVAVLSFAAPWLPDPIGSRAYLIPLCGFVFLIVAGLRSAFREDEAGVFAFWRRPKQMAESRLDQGESRLSMVALTMLLASVLSFAVRVALL